MPIAIDLTMSQQNDNQRNEQPLVERQLADQRDEIIDNSGDGSIQNNSNKNDSAEQQQAQSPVRPSETARAEIMISGMTCTMCIQAIETAIRKNVPGITAVEISLATDTAEVEWTVHNRTDSDDDGNASETQQTLDLIRSTVTDIGYDVEEVRLLRKKRKDKITRQTTIQSVENGNGDENAKNGNDPKKSKIEVIQTNNDNRPDNDNNDDDDDEEETVEERWQRYRNHQTRKLVQRRNAFVLSLVGTVPILFLTMILPNVINMDRIFHKKHVTIFHKYEITVESLLLWILATPVQFICGYEFYKMAWYGFRNGTAGMDVLVALGTSASYGYALVGVLMDDDHAAHFFETSAVLICFVLAGKWMQAVAVRRTSDALSQLMTLQSKTAIKVIPLKNSTNFNPLRHPYTEETVDITRIKVGDMVKVIRGASVPADGRVLFGEILVNESMVTGESMPVLKVAGSAVLGGTVCVDTNAPASMDNTTHEDENNANTTDDQRHSSVKRQYSSDSVDIEIGRQSIGAAFVQVTGVGSNTALAQIVKMVHQAQTRSVPIQSFADSVSAVFVPAVCVTSVITYLVWYALCSSNVVPPSWYVDELHEDAATFSLMFAIACLVISCPCALGLATPTAVMVGTGVGASKCGVLMKGGQALEIASHVTTVVLDKTGTITKGTPTVSDFVRIKNAKSIGSSDPLESNDNGKLHDKYLLWLLASLERTSEHPLAKAVVAYAEDRLGFDELQERPLAQPSQFRARTGQGCRGSITIDLYNSPAFPSDDRTDVAIGNRAYAANSGIEIPLQANDCMKILERQGKTAIFGAVDGHVCVVLGIADEVKPDAKASIYYLREKLNLDVWMVTGDNARTASAVARQLDIPADRVVSEALPADKLVIVTRLQSEGKVVAMVGDGINDSPALAQADVGMSVGSGASEIAAEASDMVLVKGDMASVCTAIHLSRAIFRRIQWNLVWSLLYNCLGIPVAAGAFYPFVHARLPPTIAALAMALSSISVVLSSLTLRFYQPPDVIEEGHTLNERQVSTTRRESMGTSTAVTENGSTNVGTNSTPPTTAVSIDNSEADMSLRLLANDHFASSESTAVIDNRS